jgi:uncharacterized protein YwgA
MAQLDKPTFRHSNIAAPDLSKGAALIVQGLNTPGNIALQMEAQNRQKQQDALATPGTPEWAAAQAAKQKYALDTMTKEQAWREENDLAYKAKLEEINRLNSERNAKELLAKEIMGMPTKKSVTNVVNPAVTKLDVDNARQNILDARYQNAGEIYADEYAKLTAPTVSKADGISSTIDNRVQNIPNPGAYTGHGYKNNIPTTNGMGLYSNVPANYKGPINNSVVSVKDALELPKQAEPMTNEEAHRIALQKAGLSEDMVGKEFTVAENKLPKVSKEVTKTSMKKLSDEELIQGKLDIVKRLVNEGAIPAALGLEVANKINAPKTAAEKTAELKYLLDLREENRKDKELTAKIKSGYFGKSSGQGFSFGEKLYTAAGPDGLSAAKDYMTKNRGKLNSLNTGDKKELLAYLTSKYGHEDDWFNWTGWEDLK